MTRPTFKPVLSLFLLALAGYAAYIPLEMVRSAQIDAASQPLAVNALLSDLKSRTDEVSPDAKTTISLAIEDERVIETTDVLTIVDLNDKTL